MPKNTEQKVNEIYDALMGEGLHKGKGVLDKIADLEAWRNKQSKRIGTIIGVAVVVGYALNKLSTLLI